MELTKYMLILILGLYTYHSYKVLSLKDKKRQDRTFILLTALVFALHFTGFFALYVQVLQDKLIFLYVGEALFMALLLTLCRIFYEKLSRPLLCNMLMLASIGFTVQARLSFDRAVRQALITGAAAIACLAVPVIIEKVAWMRRYGWLYAGAGIALMFIVLFFGKTSYGATNWLSIAGFSFQPSEIVKLLFVMSIASILRHDADIKRIITVTAIAGAHVIVLVIQKDLGGALIFFVTYVFIMYVSTNKPLYMLTGLAGGIIAACAAYRLFDHVKVRVMAWRDPFRYIDKEGYQVSQSLFAIGTGGWFGLGINRGLPTSIPVVESDFIFSAIAEEFGGLFAICLVMLYMNCFIMMINIALRTQDSFHRMSALGFSVIFGFQVILSIGGVIKFIPSTGVTLPLISFGGSSVMSTILMFFILQGIYLKRNHAG